MVLTTLTRTVLYNNSCKDGLHIIEDGVGKVVVNLVNFIRNRWERQSYNVTRIIEFAQD